MWKESLPENCPPLKAKEDRIEVYRILKEATPNENDFIPYAKLYPENPRYNTFCKAYAISFYDTFENAKIALEAAVQRGKSIGNFIGQYEITEADGKNEYTLKNGHYSTWFYSAWSFQNFNPSEVKEINEN